MSQLRPPSTLSSRIPCTIMLWVILLAAVAALPASAQTGAIAFRDDCTGLLYAMRGEGTGRIALPLPSLPLPTDRYWGPLVLDVTTSGPTTVLYYTGIARIVVVDGQNVLTLVDYGLFAVQLDEVDGVLSLAPGSPVRLTLPTDVGFPGVNPNTARHGSFSLAGSRDRLALVARSDVASVLMTARV